MINQIRASEQMIFNKKADKSEHPSLGNCLSKYVAYIGPNWTGPSSDTLFAYYLLDTKKPNFERYKLINAF